MPKRNTIRPNETILYKSKLKLKTQFLSHKTVGNIKHYIYLCLIIKHPLMDIA